MKKNVLIIVLAMVLMLVGCGSNNQKQEATYRIASLKGPTTMGLVKLMEESKEGKTEDTYQVTMHGTADEIVAGIVKGEIDIASIPANLAGVLYKKLEGKLKVAAVNTLGVLYIVETGETVKSIADLKGKTIYATGKGTTPEFVLNHILNANGLTPNQDVTIEFKSEETELANILATTEGAIAMLPEPFVTTAASKNEKLRVVLDMTQEYDRVATDGSTMVTAVVVARSEFIDNNKEGFDAFLDTYQKSTEWVNSNVDEAAQLIGNLEIVPAPVAKKAIPKCNITFITGDEMKEKLGGFLSVLYNQKPESVGGALPDENFYYND